MPRVGPNYTLPEPPFVPQTSISSAAMNSDLSDIADALTNSLARNGAGGMTAVLPLANDGFIFQNDPDTGISRSAANTMSMECGNTEIVNVSPVGINVVGSVKQNGSPILPVGLGPLPWTGLTAPSGWVLAYGQTLSRAAYAALWAFAQAEIAAGNTLYGNGDGSTNFTIPDMRGRLPGGKDNMGGTAANRLTTASNGFGAQGGDPKILGAGGGTESQTLTLGELPTGITGINSNSVPVSVTVTNGYVAYNPGSSSLVSAAGGGVVGGISVTGAGTAFLTSTGTIAIGQVGFTSNNTSGQAHPIVQPTLITNYIIFAGV